MARTPFQGISAPVAIQPIAQPVNTYVRPAEPAPSPLHDLAQGLAAFDEGLSSFMEKRQAKFDEADKIRAEAAFNENNSLGWAEAVRQGKVPANASPVFMRSYKAAQGNLAGIQLREKFNAEYMKWDGKNSNDPNAFNTFLGDFIKNNVDTQDPDVLRGLNPHIRQLWQDGHDVFGKDSANSVYKGAVDTAGAIAGRTVDAANQQGLDTKEGTNYEALWTDIQEQRKQALASGMRKEDYDKQMVAAITAKAVELRDPKLLDLLDKKAEGDDVSLKDYPLFRDAKQDAMDKLETIARQQENDLDKKQAKEDKAKEEVIWTGVSRLIASDPNQQVPEDVLQELEKYDPKARQHIAEMRKSLADEREFEDPKEIMQIQRDIAERSMTRADILKLAADGKIRDPNTLSSLLDRVEKFDKARREGTGILTSQTAKRFTKAIAERMHGPEEKIFTDIFGNVAMNDESLQAIQDFESALMEWDDKNPDASIIDREKFINETGNMILQRIDPQLTSTDANKYKGEADIAREKFREQTANTPLPEDLTHQGNNEVEKFFQSDNPPMIDTLPDDSQKYIEDAAKKLGMTPDELNAEIWKRAKTVVHSAETPAGPTGEQPGLLEQGNIDLKHRPQVKLEDGSIATVRSMSFEEDGKEILVPTVSPDGKLLTDQEAIDLYHKTGQFLGKFDTPENANAFAEKLHQAQDAFYLGDHPQADTADHQTAIIPSTVEDLNKLISHPPQSVSDAIGTMIDNVVKNQGMSTTLSDNKQAASFLNLLGHSEATDRGRGYDETLNYGAYTGGPVDLTKMTMKQVDDLQTKMLRNPNNKLNSSAVGRYQATRTTLRAWRKEHNIPDDAVFDQAMQDRFAIDRLKFRGYDKWIAGEMSDKTFANNLAKEWASLPTDRGTSAYKGQHASVSRDSVLSALQVMKSGASPFDSILTGKDPSQKADAVPAAYAKIPQAELPQFLYWNSDPVANDEKNRKSVDPKLAQVIDLARKKTGIKFVVGAGKRTTEQQKKAVEWGWSKTMKSDHLDGKAADLWVLGDDGAVDFNDHSKQAEIAKAMKAAAKELGVNIEWGGDFKSFVDRPHFALK